jgi:hypothetical protein
VYIEQDQVFTAQMKNWRILRYMRALRKKQIVNRQFKDYLIYAMGEIVLVMIGILLALQVDTWNQNRKDRNTERKAIVSLLEEFKLNKLRIEEKQQQRQEAFQNFKVFIEAATHGTASDSLMRATHNASLFSGFTNPSYGIIKSLVSSGEINLIRNDSLRYLLADWEDQTMNLRENEEILWDFTLAYKALMDDYLLIPDVEWVDQEAFDRATELEGLFETVTYRNKLITLHSVIAITIAEADETIARLNKIIQLMEEELRE